METETKTKTTENDMDNTGNAERKSTAAEPSDKRYKTAFYIMTGVVLVLFASLIGILYIHRASVKQIDYYENTVVRSYTFPEESHAELRINVNTADVNELTLLPGIGESRAKDIIEYRTEYGKFTKPEDLLKIRGIGEATLEGLLPYIVFEDQD